MHTARWLVLRCKGGSDNPCARRPANELVPPAYLLQRKAMRHPGKGPLLSGETLHNATKQLHVIPVQTGIHFYELAKCLNERT